MTLNRTIFSLHMSNVVHDSPIFALRREKQSFFEKCSFSHIFPRIFYINHQITKLDIKSSSFSRLQKSIIYMDKLNEQCEFPQKADTETTTSVTDCSISDYNPQEIIFNVIGNDGPGTDTEFQIYSSTFTEVNSSYPFINCSLANLYIYNTRFQNCTAPSPYGIIRIENSKNTTFNGIYFYNCTTKDQSPPPEESGDTGTSTDTPDSGEPTQTPPTTNSLIYTYKSYFYLYDFLFNNTIPPETEESEDEPTTAAATDPSNLQSYINLDTNQFSYIQYGLFEPTSDMTSCFTASKSLQIQLLSVAFRLPESASASLYPIALTSSQLIANHICKNHEKEYLQNNDGSIVILIDSDFTTVCNVDDIKAPTTPPATELTDAQNVAAIITLVFFIVFFVFVFVTLISLVFCKVGLSEELTFSENHSFEEDSFESFAN